MSDLLVPRSFQEELIRLSEERRVFLEGNILKLITYDGNDDFQTYVDTCIEKDREKRSKTLEVTKQVQDQNKELEKKALELEAKAEENETLMEDLKVALEEAENAKTEAINDLDLMQKKTQFELIGNIVSTALYTIIGVGVITTGLYALAILANSDQITLLGNTWSNMFGILLTNSFSIIGTIMGVKYASEKEKSQ